MVGDRFEIGAAESLPAVANVPLHRLEMILASAARSLGFETLDVQTQEQRFNAMAVFQLSGLWRRLRSRRSRASFSSRTRLMSGFDPRPPSRGTPSATLPRAPRLHPNRRKAARSMPPPGPSAAYRIPEGEYRTLLTPRPFGSQPISSTDWLFCDSSAAAKISWVATASCGVAHPNRPSKRPSRSAK